MSALTDILVRLLTSKNSQLHRAVSKGDAVALEGLIKDGACVYYMPRSGSEYTGDSPVHVAVRNNDVACLRVLMAHGGCIHSAGIDRKPPLACWFEYQAAALVSCGRFENLPPKALDVGAFLLESGARLGSGGWVSTLTGRTPQDSINANPELKRLQEYMDGGYQSEQVAKNLGVEAPQACSVRPRSRL